jgi:hypothetical protein
LNELKAGIYFNSKADINEIPFLTIDAKLSEDVMIVDWMMNPSELSKKSEPSMLIVPEVLINDHVQIENWMIEPGWKSKGNKIENLMTTPGNRNVKNVNIQDNCQNDEGSICSLSCILLNNALRQAQCTK